MSESSFIIDTTEHSFQQTVIDGSRQQLVVADFWAPWCGPCKMLIPLLTQLAEEYGGKFVLAKINTDQEQALANQFAIRSIPTVMLFKNGEVVDQFFGMLPESEIRAKLDAHIDNPADALLQQAEQALNSQQRDQATALIDQAIALAPELDRIRIKAASLLLAHGIIDRAGKLLDHLAINMQLDPAVIPLTARLAFARSANDGPTEQQLQQQLATQPDDCDARYRLAAHKVVAQDYPGAMDLLLDIMKINRQFEDDAARKAMIRIFEILGNQGEVVQKYRMQMARLLY